MTTVDKIYPMDESNLNELKDIIFNLDITVDKKSCMVIFTETSDCIAGQFNKIELVLNDELNVCTVPIKSERIELKDPIAVNLIKRYVNTKQLFNEIIQLSVPNFVERKTNNFSKLRTDCTAELVHKDFLEILVEYRVIITQD